ncbi:MAG: hypothetical protein J6X00_02380 [Clostridia bacterium]|nr:hypothetical protein [Clostridia bacterium]
MEVIFHDIERLNKLIGSDKKKVINDTESKYRSQLFQLADIIHDKKNVDIILLAGPSCAGKTTSARLLKEVLEKRGMDVVTISMDDFFIDREKTPFLPNGLRDLDNPKTVNVELMEKCFKSFWSGKETGFPVYDFKLGVNIPDSFKLTKKDNTIVIFEGLHTLNPYLYEHLGTQNYFRVYVSAMTGFRYEDELLDNVELRLLRRIIRDVDTRGHNPASTLKSWESVCDAENKYINPFRGDVDYFINTTHAYELSVYKRCVAELRARGKLTDEDIANISFMPVVMHCDSISRNHIPDTSLMWEFIQKPYLGKEEGTEVTKK